MNGVKQMDTELLNLETCLSRFREECEKSSGPIPYSFSFGQESNNFQVVYIAAMHGNEVGGIAGILSALKILRTHQSYKINLIFIIGNPMAVQKGKRFLEHDLNRLFVDESNLVSDESIRAREIMSVIRSSNAVIDLHQTIQPTLQPFYIFSEHKPSWSLANSIGGASIYIADQSFPTDERSADQFAQSLGIPGISVELSQMGLREDAIDFATHVILKSAEVLDQQLGNGKLEFSASGDKADSLQTIEVVGDILFENPKDQLLEGWQNLSPVKRGEILGNRADGSAILANHDGFILFPKYPLRDSQGYPIEAIPRQMCLIAAMRKRA